MSSELAGGIIKRGEIVIQFTIHRSPRVDVSMSVKVHPTVEGFIQGLGTGDTTDVRTLGRSWVPIQKDVEFRVYDVSLLPALDEKYGFTLTKPGRPLLEIDENSDQEVVNLSFLRLRGASEGAGITFGIRGVHTLDMLKITRDKLTEACRQFFIIYMKPVDLTAMVSTQEINP